MIEFGRIPELLSPDLAKGLLTGGPAFCGLFLAFAYFVMQWATGRIKDWESQKDPRLGSPALLCWIAGAGGLMTTMIGAHVFAALYLALNGVLYLWHIPMLLGMLVMITALWLVLIKWIIWYFKMDGDLSNMTGAKLAFLVHSHTLLRWTVPCIVVVGTGSILECVAGDFIAGLAGVLFELSASFAIGAYSALRGDLLERTVICQ